ncbi:Tn7-like element transposition protein TnsE [Aneurinibacillus aneurinilyticus]|uniref:Tn7-like element transposition protein TnsE n=1 Tax=Aneurinibacillus aneurinilyticus TaxID=1391 RepID=UPI0023F51CD6|nr:Tn7-like element transposition protein TnsE [Aneurinibacillus aneurinilyticus]
MSKQQVNSAWPFPNGEDAQLTWIGEPFKQNSKFMMYVYFQGKGRTEKLLMDWGSLPLLAIQRFYKNGNFTSSKVHKNDETMEITLYPDHITRSERPWSIIGYPDKLKSRNFLFRHEGSVVMIPIIEVIRGILAPNRFLLYRLLESNSFPLYFVESLTRQQLHFDFSSSYHKKYTAPGFLNQLAWLFTNPDIKRMYDDIAFNLMTVGELSFDWRCEQPITVVARVQRRGNSILILEVLQVKNKQIHCDVISFTHPEIRETVQSNEPKLKRYRKLNGNGENDDITLDHEIDGSTEDFDLIQMNQLVHQYVFAPAIKKVKGNTVKQRTKEDESTKTLYIDSDYVRTTADSGGSSLVRGLEHQSLEDILVRGELQEFVNILKIMEQRDSVRSIQIIIDNLPEGLGERKFARLSDGITRRKYIVAKVDLDDGRYCNVVEIEREGKSLSTLILSSNQSIDWNKTLGSLLTNLVNDSGVWSSKSIKRIENKGIMFKKAKHVRRSIRGKEEYLFEKLWSIKLGNLKYS